MDIEKTIDDYITLRERCYEIMKANPKEVLGQHLWLQHVIYSGDLNLSYTIDGINCWGSTFTSQTQDNEFFEFTISRAELET
jgi:hypothetical protein